MTLKLPAPTIIFVKPIAAGNVGALSRVMSNFGCSDLRLVGPEPTGDVDEEYTKMDWAMACKGQPVLETAIKFSSLKEALVGIHIAIGTSGKKDNFERGYARPFVMATHAFAGLQKELQTQSQMKWALVFGTESDGLTSDEAALCQQLIQIQSVDTSPSINIAMAAGLLLYHWHLFNLGQIQHPNELTTPSAFMWEKNEIPSSLAEKEQWLEYLIATLSLTQFFKYPDHEGLKARMRRWLQSFQVPRGELLLAFEALYQLKSWGQGRFEERDFLKK